MLKLSLVDGMNDAFKLVDPLDAKTVVVFDVSNLAWRCWSIPSFKDMKFNDKPTGHIFGTFKTIMAYVKKACAKPPVSLVFALDGYAKYRYDVYPGYKSGRDHKSSGDPMPDVTRMVRLLPGHAAFLPKWEADDAIASFVKWYKDNDGKGDVRIVTADNDMIQLVQNKNVTWWESASSDPLDRFDLTDRGISPSEILLRKSLFGDKSDRITGIPRLSLTPELDELIGDADGDFKAFMDGLKRLPEPVRRRVKSNMAILKRNRDLVRLREKPLEPARNVTSRKQLEDFLVGEFGCQSLAPLIPRFFGA